MGRAPTYGLMEEPIKENGKTITCTVKEFTPGRTAENMTASMLMTESTDLESTLGPTVVSILDNGKMEDNMGKVSIEWLMVDLEKDYGKMVEDKDG